MVMPLTLDWGGNVLGSDNNSADPHDGYFPPTSLKFICHRGVSQPRNTHILVIIIYLDRHKLVLKLGLLDAEWNCRIEIKKSPVESPSGLCLWLIGVVGSEE